MVLYVYCVLETYLSQKTPLNPEGQPLWTSELEGWVSGVNHGYLLPSLATGPTGGEREDFRKLSSDLHIHEAAWVYPTHEKQINK